MNKGDLLYSGKAKSVYQTDDNDLLVLQFRNDTSAFDGKKVEQLDRKGMVNNIFNAFVMEKLAVAGVPTHLVKRLSPTESLVKNLTMIPVECVIRNRAAGSLTRRLGIAEGTELNPPVYEYFLKNDVLGDPMITPSHIETFGWATAEQLQTMTELTFKVNDILKPLFMSGDMLLVDFKLEFGVFHDEIVLGDEFSPDGCRLWDKETLEKLDKDRFRQGLGQVVESYEMVGQRLGLNFNEEIGEPAY